MIAKRKGVAARTSCMFSLGAALWAGSAVRIGATTPFALVALGNASWQRVLKALPGGQTRVRLDARMALPPYGKVEWRASRVPACGWND